MKLSSLLTGMAKAAGIPGAPQDSALPQLSSNAAAATPLTEEHLSQLVAQADSGQIERCVDIVAKSMGERSDPASAARACDAGRFLALAVKDRKKGVAATMRLSSQDGAFMEHILLGDKCRDTGKWAEGELHYWRSLCLYPLHGGYRVQYAHCLKEQGKFVDAEIQYRNALALGEMHPDLIRHLRFVAERAARPVNNSGLDKLAKFWAQPAANGTPLAIPATERDISSTGDLLLGRSAWSVVELADIMNSAPLMSDVVGYMLERPEFASLNRDLLLMLVETREARP